MSDGTTIPDRRVVITRQKHRGQYFSEPLTEPTRQGTLNLEMMLIPGGSFMMGQTEAERTELIRLVGEETYQSFYSRELPRHPVTIQQFFMGKYPVTQAQWRVVAGYAPVEQELDPDPSKFKGDNRPVENVSWDDATEFCQRLSQHTGRTYRLPSEAEWEYACRAGTETPFHFGETLSVELANYCAQDKEFDGKFYQGIYGRGVPGQYRGETTNVGSFLANPFGLYDMHGNVWEWCEDDYHDTYNSAPDNGNAWVNSNHKETWQVLRGGSWYSVPRYCHSAMRFNAAHDLRNNDFGFRVCCELPVMVTEVFTIREKLPPSELIQQCLNEDEGNLFKRTYIPSYPSVNFQQIALLHLVEGQSFRQIADQLQVPYTSLVSFYQRRLKQFAPIIRAYCLN